MIPVEPSADARVFAHTTREVYIALRAEGFSYAEALDLIQRMFAASREET